MGLTTCDTSEATAENDGGCLHTLPQCDPPQEQLLGIKVLQVVTNARGIKVTSDMLVALAPILPSGRHHIDRTVDGQKPSESIRLQQTPALSSFRRAKVGLHSTGSFQRLGHRHSEAAVGSRQPAFEP